MRHRKKFNHLGRKKAHRNSMLANMACSLIEHKRIKTTHQKALELRKFIEPMITKAKNHTVHNRREVLKKIHNDDAVKTLFDVIAPSYTDRPGGYTRIIKLGSRVNDAAKISLIEFVDKFNFDTEEVVDVTEDSTVEEEVKE